MNYLKDDESKEDFDRKNSRKVPKKYFKTFNNIPLEMLNFKLYLDFM